MLDLIVPTLVGISAGFISGFIPGIGNFACLLILFPYLFTLDPISSIKTEMKSQYWGIYQPIMTALNELVLSFANENKGTSINANIIYPGAVNTKFRENIMPGENKKQIKDPVDVASAIVKFLLSNEKSGEIIKL